MTPARAALAAALREARHQVALTQEEFGKKIGLKDRAVYRWERGESKPSPLNRRMLLNLLGPMNQQAAAKLKEAFATFDKSSAVEAPPSPAPVPATLPVTVPRALLEQGVFAMADELDLPPRRVRGALARWLRRIGDANPAFDAIRGELDAWIGAAQ
jgi:DNA-binding XRE family transcriptional regulator